MSNGEASLARFATCLPVVRGVTGLRAGALDAGDFARVATEVFAAPPLFAAALFGRTPPSVARAWRSGNWMACECWPALPGLLSCRCRCLKQNALA